ncbi:hypothetical protein PHLCEN_2v5229, partial [Hermanssonia centrifuga]
NDTLYEPIQEIGFIGGSASGIEAFQKTFTSIFPEMVEDGRIRYLTQSDWFEFIEAVW